MILIADALIAVVSLSDNEFMWSLISLDSWLWSSLMITYSECVLFKVFIMLNCIASVFKV